MAEGRAEIHRIVWSELCPWLLLLRVFRQAMRLRALALAAAGVMVSMLGWHAIGYVFSGSEELSSGSVPPRVVFERWPWEAAVVRTSTSLGDLRTAPTEAWSGVFGTQPFEQLAAVHAIFSPTASVTLIAYLLLCLLWGVAVWSLLGGGITRLAALGLARGEQIEMVTALRYAAGRWKSYFAGPTLPLVGVLILAAILAVGGLCMRIPYVGPFVGGLAWPLWLLGGFLISLLVLMLAVNWPLMWCTISCEGTDSLDSLGRAYGYLYGKPLRYLFYVLVALLLGWLGGLVVSLFVEAIIGFSMWATSWGAGATLDAMRSGGDSVAAVSSWLFNFWNDALRLLPTAYGYAYFWTAATGVYLLLRRDEDDTQIDEIFREEEAATYGLPPLQPTATGVPQVADPPAAGAASNEPSKDE